MFLNSLQFKPLVNVAQGETVFVAVGDLNKVEVAMDFLVDSNWEYMVWIFHLYGVIEYEENQKEWEIHGYEGCVVLDQEERIYRYQKSEMVSRMYNNIWM